MAGIYSKPYRKRARSAHLPIGRNSESVGTYVRWSREEPHLYEPTMQVLILGVIYTAAVPFVFIFADSPPTPPSAYFDHLMMTHS